MAKFIVVLGPVSHDGKQFDDGDEIELDRAGAAPLLAAKVVVEQGKSKRIEAAKKAVAAAEEALAAADTDEKKAAARADLDKAQEALAALG